MILRSNPKLQPDHSQSESRESILIITDNTPEATQLTAQLSAKGYPCFSLPLCSALDNAMPGHLAIIVVVNCQGACCQLKEDRLLNHNRSIPVICLNALHNRDRRSNLKLLELLTGILEPQPPPIQGFISELPEMTQERRRIERRKSVRLNSNFSGAGVGTLEPDDSVITLSIISERDNHINKLATYLTDTPTFKLDIAGVNNLKILPKKLAQLHPDLLLIDTALTDGAFAEWLQAIRQADATVKIILLYDNETHSLMKEIVEFGISGIIKTDAGPDLFKKAIRTVHQGDLWLPHHLMSRIISHFSKQGPLLNRHPHIDLPEMINASLLTQREINITQRVAQGLTNKEIAKALNVSPETIKKHLKSIFEKSGVHTRSQLAAIYSGFQMIDSLPIEF
ncbi:MAG: response regulator transcription factor [Methylomicrobium sp.]|nr:response regulator transcription factor [Methylomicrobium sp.]